MNISPICNLRLRASGIKFRFEIFMRAEQFSKFAVILIFGLACNAIANPTGMTVSSGSATASQNGPQLTVTASQNAFLNWQSFNIAASETTIFQQPSAQSIVWNQINDQNPSQIFGNLQANGVVVLMNSSGFYFGPNSFVSAAGLVVSTAPNMPQNSGGAWEFNGPPPAASIVNYGKIKIDHGGSAFLIADNVQNFGDIIAPGGTIGIAAGQDVLVSERPDGRGLSMKVTLPEGAVDNEGHLVADAGTISVNAQTVNQNGFVQANSVRDENGVIELVASDKLNLGANSKIIARGDDSAPSGGGSVTLQSGNDFSDQAGGEISVAGGAQGGDGGGIEVSAPNILSLNSKMDARAQPGWTSGKLILDPYDIILDSSGSDSAGGGAILSGDDAGGTLDLNVNSAFSGFSTITLQATHDITLAGGTFFALSDNTGVSDGQLTLEAGNDIIFGDQAIIYDENNWSVTLKAGVNDFNAGTVQPGTGSIYLNGGPEQQYSGAIQTATGSISLLAGQDILLGASQASSSAVVTTGGGNIDVTAVAGSVNTGTDQNGFVFFPSSYTVFAANLGGISTGAGGNVNITAGQDIISYLPSGNNPAGDAGSGAFGIGAPGSVTLTAGRDITGHYVVADGTGTINSGVDAGTTANVLALSLIDGGWTVNAAHDINLQEVRNPSGILNGKNSSFSAFHRFDYAPGDFVSLNAGDAVALLGNNLPRNSGENIPSIYPPTLDITAGAGGVAIDSEVILYPSPLGSLEISTTDGGSLAGPSPNNPTQLIMSDSGATQYKFNTGIAPFGPADHAATPVHLNSPTPVQLNIAGDMDDIYLIVPEAAQITVGGNMDNSRFLGQNLQASDVTSITVAGDILNRNEFTSVTLASAPDLSLLAQAFPSPLSDLLNRLFYDPTTMTLTLQGILTASDYNAVTSLQVEVFDQNGAPVVTYNPDGSTSPVTKTVSILDPATAAALLNGSQNVPQTPNTGYVLGGGGAFDISARNLDLGATLGIQSVGPENNPALANILTRGAGINLNLSGNLNMFSTTISSLNGGNISVNAGGDVNVGSSTFTGNNQYARGIFTTAQSDVSVIANGDIEVNGSRIAAYDGGNVTVESLDGNVDAGTGGNGSVAVSEIYVDPLTRKIYSFNPVIPGSGILATTFPPRDSYFPAPASSVGNILVETPQGSINASSGGIVQLPLNGNQDSAATVTLDAGTRDAAGNVLYTGDINTSGSGVIGSNVKLDATGNIVGLIFARNNADVTALQNANVTVLAQGSATVSAGGNISGTIIGVAGISASGGSIDASLLSQNISPGVETSGQRGFSQGTAANSTSQGLANDQTTKAAESSDENADDKKKKGKQVVLAQKVSRVTVILPPKNKS
jgi:filamentous hemagglutinin family protein